MRIYLLYLVILGLALYAWRDWFMSLCGLILLLAFVQRREFPSAIMGIQGLNPWNALFACILLAWLVHRGATKQPWDMPPLVMLLLGMFLAVLTIADIRALVILDEFSAMYRGTRLSFISDEWINPVKLLMTGVMLYDGARTRNRVLWGLGCTLGMIILWALLTVKYVPITVLADESNFMKFRHRLDRDVGLFATDLGMVFAGGFWAILSAWPLMKNRWQRIGLLATSGLVLIALALTYSRGGYVTWAVIGFVFAVLRWRWMFAVAPVMVIALAVAMPSVVDRMMMGFGTETVEGAEETDLDEVTSGRTTYLWPNAVQEVINSPVIGHGKLAILHTDMFWKVFDVRGLCPRHPHNAYLELLMDTGVVGFVPVMCLYWSIFGLAAKFFWGSLDPLERAVGGACMALTLMLLVAGLGSQTFHGNQISTTGIWLSAALCLAMYVRNRRGAPAPAVVPVRRPVRSYPAVMRHSTHA